MLLHLSTCEWVMEPCPNDGCDLMCYVKEIAEHTKRCKYVFVLFFKKKSRANTMRESLTIATIETFSRGWQCL